MGPPSHNAQGIDSKRTNPFLRAYLYKGVLTRLGTLTRKARDTWHLPEEHKLQLEHKGGGKRALKTFICQVHDKSIHRAAQGHNFAFEKL